MPYWINLIAALVSLVMAALTGKFLIPLMRKLHFGQTIYETGPSWHKSKNGTPLMGGFMFIISTVVACALCWGIWRITNRAGAVEDNYLGLKKLVTGLVFALGNGLIGFLDDYIKAIKKQNKGLNPKQKMAMQFVLSVLFLGALYILGDTSTEIIFPFIGSIDFGIFYYIIMILYIIFLTNAVNLTDGVDGLCGSVTVVFCASYLMIFAFLGEWEYSIYAAALAGGCLGFLVWNFHPAKVFMGDTGSMFLGGSVVAMGFITHQHLLLALVGIIYICEALSVVLQVISFKTTGKRIFKMSPIHHHFELCGFSEYKIVLLFSAVALIAGILGNIITIF